MDSSWTFARGWIGISGALGSSKCGETVEDDAKGGDRLAKLNAGSRGSAEMGMPVGVGASIMDDAASGCDPPERADCDAAAEVEASDGGAADLARCLSAERRGRRDSGGSD